MGIQQLPSAPTPVTKGSIAVGTGTGTALLPVSALNNQSLLSDSTQTTGLKYGSPTRQWTSYTLVAASTASGNPNASGSTIQSQVIYGNGYYAFATGRFVWYSTDGKNWQTVLVHASTLYGLVTNPSGSVWLAYGSTNAIFSAPNPSGPWTARTSNMSGTSNIQVVEWVPSYNLFVLTGNCNASPFNVISTSPDGFTWTARFTGGGAVSNGITMSNNLSTTTVVGFASGSQTGAFSTNGTTWTSTNINGGTAYNGQIIWMPTAGRFQCLASNQYSQTAANVATAWGTAPIVAYNTFTYTPLTSSGTNGLVWKPIYDASTQRWYAISGGEVQGNSMVIVDDTQATLFYYTTGSEFNYMNRVISQEKVPYAFYGGSTGPQYPLSYANGYFFLVGQDSNRAIIMYNTIP